MLKRAGIVYILLLLSVLQGFAQPCVEDFSYRRSVSVGNASGATQTNQLVEIEIEAQNLINDSKLLSNCADVRFTDISGNPLSYWIDVENSKTNRQSVWVKLSSVPVGGTTIYMFYGNPSALSASDESIFEFFDNLDNLDNWNTCGGNTLNNGKVILGNGNVIKTKQEYPHNYAVEAYINNTTGSSSAWLSLGQLNTYNQASAISYRPDDPANGSFELTETTGSSCPQPVTTIMSSTTTPGEGVWSFSFNSTTKKITGKTAEIDMNSPVTISTTSGSRAFLAVKGAGSLEVDWVRIRKISGAGITATLNSSEVVINSTTELNIASNAPFCAGSGNTLTLSASNITGATYQWRHNGQALSSNSNMVNVPNADAGNSGTYTVLVNLGSPVCATKTAQVDVVIDRPVSIGQITAGRTVCETSNSGVIKLQNYTGNITGWQYRVNNSGLWYDMITPTSSLRYSNLKETHSFRAKVESGTCGSAVSNTSTITVSPATNTGTISEDKIKCKFGSGNISLSGYTGNIQYWESSTDKTNWSGITHKQGTYQYIKLAESKWFRAAVKSGVCQQRLSEPVLITVNDSTRGGYIEGGDYVCADNNRETLHLKNNVGNIIRWEFAPTATGPWSENSSHDPYFITQALRNTTYYRALIENPGCPEKYSELDTIIVEQKPDAGELIGAGIVCASGNSGSLKLKSYTGKVVDWIYSTDNSSWIHQNHEKDSLQYSNLKQDRHFRVLVNTEHKVCIPDTSEVATIKVSKATVSGNLYSNKTVLCELQNNETIRLNGETGSVERWESSPNGEAPWATIFNTTDSLVFNNLKNTTYYRAVVKSGACEQKISQPIKIQIDKESEGGSAMGSTEVCETVNAGEVTLLNNAGSIALWEQSTDKQNWSTYPNSIGNVLKYDSLPDTTYFRAIVKSGQCPYDTSEIAKITVNPLPDVAFLAGNVNLGDRTFFQNKTTISGGHVQSWLWDFGDNESTASKNPVHTYEKEGNYHVRLTAFSNKNCVDSASKVVSVFGLPDVDFIFNNVCLFYETQFTNTSNITPGTTFTWKFGDGTTVSGVDAMHKYKNPGNYEVTLKAISASGGVDSVVKTVVVYQRTQPEFKTGNVCEGEVANFTNHTQPTSLNFTCQWDFGNGKTDIRINPEVQYKTPGSYLVKLLTTTSDGCKDSIKKAITVFPKPVADFTVSDVPYRQPSVFINQSSVPYGKLSYKWNFGDGENSDSTNPEYIYGASGVYQVKLEAISDSGCIATKEKAVKIFDLPVAKFSFDNVCFGDSVKFANESTVPAGILSYEWDFGDGSKSKETSPNHTYENPGSYVATLICKSDYGARDTVEHIVLVFDLPVADFSFNEACDGATTHFENLSTVPDDEIASVLWDFDDGSNSVQLHPKNEFLNPGNYNVSLNVVSRSGCQQSITKPVILHPNPLSDFSAESVCMGEHTGFVNTSQIDNTTRPYTLFYSWGFGDGTESVLKDPEYKYQNPGIYRVQLVTSTNAGCHDTLVRYIEVFAWPEVNAGMDTTVTKGFPITLEATGGELYEWSPETGLSDISVPNPEARPMETTQYSVRVIDENNCVNSDTLTVFVEDEMKVIPSNILTPNNNNENDTWSIVNIDSYPNAEVMLFDRWGKLVYETTNYQNDWTGINQNGDILPDGTYYYVVVLNRERNIIYKGAITILRDK